MTLDFFLKEKILQKARLRSRRRGRLWAGDTCAAFDRPSCERRRQLSVRLAVSPRHRRPDGEAAGAKPAGADPAAGSRRPRGPLRVQRAGAGNAEPAHPPQAPWSPCTGWTLASRTWPFSLPVHHPWGNGHVASGLGWCVRSGLSVGSG